MTVCEYRYLELYEPREMSDVRFVDHWEVLDTLSVLLKSIRGLRIPGFLPLVNLPFNHLEYLEVSFNHCGGYERRFPPPSRPNSITVDSLVIR